MSLEIAIQQNTAAINALIEMLAKGVVPAAAPAETSDEAPKAKRTKKEAAPVEAPEPVAEEPTPEPATEDAAPPSYAETGKWVIELSNTKGAMAAREILAGFGGKKLTEVKASDYAAVIEACKAALA